MTLSLGIYAKLCKKCKWIIDIFLTIMKSFERLQIIVLNFGRKIPYMALSLQNWNKCLKISISVNCQTSLHRWFEANYTVAIAIKSWSRSLNLIILEQNKKEN